MPQLQDLLPQFWFCEVCHIKTDDDRGSGAEPPPCRRARDTQVRGNSQVSGASDEIPEPMVVALLRARGSPHLDDRRSFARPDQILEDLAGSTGVRRPPPATTTRAQRAECPCRQLAGLSRRTPRAARRQSGGASGVDRFLDGLGPCQALDLRLSHKYRLDSGRVISSLDSHRNTGVNRPVIPLLASLALAVDHGGQLAAAEVHHDRAA